MSIYRKESEWLGRREIENYLWDKVVVRKALQNMGADDTVIENILEKYPFDNPKEDDMKADNLQQNFFEHIRNIKGVSRPGRDRKEFMFAHLALALRETTEIYQELRDDVFDTYP